MYIFQIIFTMEKHEPTYMQILLVDQYKNIPQIFFMISPSQEAIILQDYIAYDIPHYTDMKSKLLKIKFQ